MPKVLAQDLVLALDDGALLALRVRDRVVANGAGLLREAWHHPEGRMAS